MLIQHILTEEIFSRVFDNTDYHRNNNVARLLQDLEDRFFVGDLKRRTANRLLPYYAAIRRAADSLVSRTEKQSFIKGIYEDFYRVYNPKAADRLGVVYTPNQIVRFMIGGTDWLCETTFNRSLIDNVEILDPAAGTGTFIVEMIEFFSGNKGKLRRKYAEELHANELAILPYYVANLNIEATYASIMDQYVEYENLCLMDTLDNTAGLSTFIGDQGEIFVSWNDENLSRIKRQNERKISVVIGNPPYNAWQENYNQQNANKIYKRIDKRIADTYVKAGSARNMNSVYDMYTRFIRWSSDRIRDDGIVALITGRKPFTKLAYNGFRLIVEKEFAEIRIVDLGGDVRENPRLNGYRHNVFGIQTGVCIMFLIKKSDRRGKAKIYYYKRPEYEVAQDKLAWLSTTDLRDVSFDLLRPDATGEWFGTSGGVWDTFIPLCDPKAGPGNLPRPVNAIFRLSSNGVQTKRDEWAYGITKSTVERKMRNFLRVYKESVEAKEQDFAIKWDRELTRRFRKFETIKFNRNKVTDAAFRPFVKKHLYYTPQVNAFQFRLPYLFRGEDLNPTIAFLSKASSNKLACFAVDQVFDTSLLKAGNGSTQGVSMFRFTKRDEKVHNVTDFALEAFRLKFGKHVSKREIFFYVYSILNDDAYATEFRQQLTKEMPRIPLYVNFRERVKIGRRMFNLHCSYMKARPYALQRSDLTLSVTPTPKLKSDVHMRSIIIDTQKTLNGIPADTWSYQLAGRAGIDWVLDQYRAKHFDAKDQFDLADHKATLIELLSKVVRVSLSTVRMQRKLAGMSRDVM